MQDFRSGDEEQSRRKSDAKRSSTTTLVACTECRRARAKCDGVDGERCTRCRGRELSCLYEPHTKVQKDELIKELQASRAREADMISRNNEYSTIIDELVKHKDPEKVISRLQSGESVGSVAQWIEKSNESSSHKQEGSLGEKKNRSKETSPSSPSKLSMDVQNLLN